MTGKRNIYSNKLYQLHSLKNSKLLQIDFSLLKLQEEKLNLTHLLCHFFLFKYYYIWKIYVGPIQMVDRQSTQSTSIHSRVLPIQFRALSTGTLIYSRALSLDIWAPRSIPELFVGSSSTRIYSRVSHWIAEHNYPTWSQPTLP